MKKNKDPADQEVVENMINNLNLPNIEMDSVEKMILSIFKNSNSERVFQNFNFDEFNMKTESLQSAKKEKIKYSPSLKFQKKKRKKSKCKNIIYNSQTKTIPSILITTSKI